MDSNELALLAGRQGHVAHWLVFLRARNRSTGVIESAGFWTGDDHQAFTIRGEARTYFGAGSLMDVPPISQEVGLQVQHVTVSLAVTPEVEQAIKGYDPSLQPAEIHRAVFDPVTLALIAEPTLIFAGTIDSTPMDDGGIGGVNVITAVIASKVRALTKTLPIYKSDAALRARAPADGFRKYVAEAAQWAVPWGTKTASGKGSGSGLNITINRDGIISNARPS